MIVLNLSQRKTMEECIRLMLSFSVDQGTNTRNKREITDIKKKLVVTSGEREGEGAKYG